MSIAVLVGTCLVPMSAEADGTQPDTTDGWMQSVGSAFVDQQNKLMDYTGWLASQPKFVEEGYVAPVFDTPNLHLTLWWKNVSATTEVKLQGKAEALGIRVTVKDYPYSVPQIQKAQERVWAVGDLVKSRGFDISSIVGISGDGVPGLTVEGVSTESLDLGTLGEYLSGVSTLPVRVRDGQTIHQYAVTRGTDNTPFFAGGYMINPTDLYTCSTGFSIKISGTPRSTTARHCTHTAYHDRDNTSKASYGYSVQDSPDGAAKIMSQPGGGRMFDGAYNNPDGYSKPVQGLRDVGKDALVCTSGGNSGVHCDIRITDMGISYNDGIGYVSVIRGDRASGIAAAGGDSGGPVLIPYSGGDVGAVGMIQGGGNNASSCGALRDPNNPCSTTVYFTSERTIVESFNGAASLILG